jgi:predicted PurR-regulated permease PerM
VFVPVLASRGVPLENKIKDRRLEKPAVFFLHFLGISIIGSCKIVRQRLEYIKSREPRMSENRSKLSPPWSTTTKLVVALTFVAIVAGLLVRFHTIIAPLLLAFILVYLLTPVVGFLVRSVHVSWRLAVNLLYLVLVLSLLGLLTWGGVGLVQQIQSLITLIENSLASIPDLIQQFSAQTYQLGPFQIDLRSMDLNALSQQLLAIVQPLLSRTGDLVSTLATGAIQILVWTVFILLVSYFILLESGGLRGRIIAFDIPGYGQDFRNFGDELSRIWNAFLRGQIIIFGMTVLIYSTVMSILGVRYAIGLALLAGLAKFLPYIGPAITWVTLGLVAYFQVFKLFGLSPFLYVLLVVGLSIVIDQVFDSLVTPRIMSQALRVHPAGVLVAAIIAANLLGILGIVIAAPILATLKLLGRYTLRKMLDLDPWPEGEVSGPGATGSYLSYLMKRLRERWQLMRAKSSEE